MKRIFWFISTAAVALGIAACTPKEKPDITNLTEDGFYVALDPTGATAVTEKEMMANGINEADNQSLRAGMYEKYIVLEANKEFSLAYIKGGKMELYGAELSEFKPESLEGIYDSNPADAVFKGKLVIGESAPKMKVSKKGLYHIVLDLNSKGDLEYEQIVLCPVTMGVRGGMNSWGFTAFDATEPSNEGITYTLSGQKLADGGEFKFAYNSAWKITLDAEGAVKANTNLGAGCKPGGDNIAVTEGAGVYKITLNYKLAAGEIAKSFSYTIEQESKSETPTTMYMIGQDFGGWDWNNAGVAELIPVWGKEGAFWCTRYFTTNGFKFCALREWNGDFTGLGSDEGYTVAEGNCFVPAEGMYTVYINLLDKVLEIKPAEVYGLGDAVFTGGWDFDTAQKCEIVDGKAVITTAGAGELRLASKVLPTTKVEGCGDHGWYDWWKTEFIFFSDNKIAYRGGGNDQDRVQIEAGKKIIIDFNNGTVAVEDGAPAGGPIATAEALLAWMVDGSTDASLGADIDLTGKDIPVCNVAGTLDGNGHTVTYSKEVTEVIPADATDKTVAPQANVGLFNFVTGTVKNLKTAGSIKFSAEAGSGTYHIGGIAGLVAGTGKIIDCVNGVNIVADTKCTHHIGGIAGFTAEGAEISGCHNTGKVEMIIPEKGAANASQLGGIVGHIEAKGVISNCVNDGQVTYEGLGTPRIAGTCGYINNLVDVTFQNCVNNGKIVLNEGAYTSTSWSYVGGITGYYGTPTHESKVLYDGCVNNGDIELNITEEKTKMRCGGVVSHGGISNSAFAEGELTWNVKNCVNNGNITCTSTTANNLIGGVIGFTETTCKIVCDGCANNGKITVGGKGRIGGILGQGCSVASTFNNFKIGSSTVLKLGDASGMVGLIMGNRNSSGTGLTTAITGDVLGGTIIKADETINITADNYTNYLLGAELGEGGSVAGVTFNGAGAGAPADVNIKIDGNFDDWASVPGAEPSGAFNAFKVWNDANNFYFYVESDPGSRLWSGGAYLYLYFNFKNDLTQGAYSGSTGMGDNKYDAYIFMYLFGGSADSPKIENNPNGGEAKGMTLDNIVIAGNNPASASDIVKMEIVVPRANFTDQVKAGDVIAVNSYRSKDGGNVYFPGYVVK